VITKLTPKQEKGITEWQQHCLKIGRDTSPINKKVVELSWKKFYKILNKKEPLFWYCQSPLQAQIIINIFPEIVKLFKISDKGANIEANIRANIEANIRDNIWANIWDNIEANIEDNIWANIEDNIRANIGDNIWANIRDNIWDNIEDNIWGNIEANIRDNIEDNIKKLNFQYIRTYSWCQHDINWIAYYKYFDKYGLLPHDKNFEIFDIWYDLSCSCGWCYTFENIVFVCEKPCKLILNNNGRLHNERGMALEYSDGYGLYMLNGVSVPKDLVEIPAEKLDPEKWLKNDNAQVRAEFVRKYGVERLKTYGESIQKTDDYELMDMRRLFVNRQERYTPYLFMRNPSVGIFHCEGVSDKSKSIESALAWRNGLKVYQPPVRLS